eukprot:scaffold4365_cov170-Amphora_coffeaeformis.AAC.4
MKTRPFLGRRSRRWAQMVGQAREIESLHILGEFTKDLVGRSFASTIPRSGWFSTHFHSLTCFLEIPTYTTGYSDLPERIQQRERLPSI